MEACKIINLGSLLLPPKHDILVIRSKKMMDFMRVLSWVWHKTLYICTLKNKHVILRIWTEWKNSKTISTCMWWKNYRSYMSCNISQSLYVSVSLSLSLRSLSLHLSLILISQFMLSLFFLILEEINPDSRVRAEKAMAPTPVLLPGKSHGQKSLVGCSPWSH